MTRSLWQCIRQKTLLAIYPDYFQQHATYFLGDQYQEYYVQLQDTKYSRDLPQGGMEIPCQYTFHREKSMIAKLKVLLSENNNQLSATSELQAKTSNSSEASQKDCSPVLPASPTTTTCSPTRSEHHSPMEHQT